MKFLGVWSLFLDLCVEVDQDQMKNLSHQFEPTSAFSRLLIINFLFISFQSFGEEKHLIQLLFDSPSKDFGNVVWAVDKVIANCWKEECWYKNKSLINIIIKILNHLQKKSWLTVKCSNYSFSAIVHDSFPETASLHKSKFIHCHFSWRVFGNYFCIN